MKLNLLTIFPTFFESILSTSILKRASQKKLVEYQIINLRDFAQGKHQSTDDRPFGGGPGMVMKIEPIDLALQSLGLEKGQAGKKIILTSAKGQLFKQKMAQNFAQLDELTLICGHYEGVDERVATYLVDAEVRIGDYVLTGGEVAAAVMTDALVRLLPGVLGNEESNQDESHSQPGLAGVEQYTQPVNYRGWQVPEILRSGDHQKITQFRNQKRQLKD